MDELLQKAFERRDLLRRELEAVEKFIHDYSTAITAPRRSAGSQDQPDMFAPKVATRAERAEAVALAMKAAERFILDEGEPLTRSELLRRLEAAGHVLEGGDKSKVLGTNLWRSGRFLNLKGVGYWPKSSPLPQRFVNAPRRSTSIK